MKKTFSRKIRTAFVTLAAVCCLSGVIYAEDGGQEATPTTEAQPASKEAEPAENPQPESAEPEASKPAETESAKWYEISGSRIQYDEKTHTILKCDPSAKTMELISFKINGNPEKVESIAPDAFAGCTQLGRVELPVSIKTIGKGAFDGCTSSGLYFYYGGSISEWAAVDNQAGIRPVIYERVDVKYYYLNAKGNGYDGPYLTGTYDFKGTFVTNSPEKRDNMRFIGYTEYEDGSGKVYVYGGTYNFSMMIGELTLYEQWQKTMTVTFDPDNGIDGDRDEIIDVGSTYVIPKDYIPTSPYDTFLGWSKKANAEKADYKPGDTLKAEDVKKDLKLYGVWSSKTFVTWTFDPMGGTNTPASIRMEKGTKTALPVDSPKLEGYKIGRWIAKNVDLTALPGEEIASDTDVTWYPYWVPEVVHHSLNYASNGGKGSPEKQIVPEGETVTVSDQKPVRSGYMFVGWSTNKLATTPDVKAGDSITLNENVTLYAIWRIYYTVSYDANGGAGVPASENVRCTESTVITDMIPTRAGYRFGGWSTTPTNQRPAYKAGDTYTEGQDLTLYAIWKPLTFVDVPADSWYSKAVSYAVEHDIANGIGGDRFAPNMVCNRAQAVVLLWKAAGSPKPANNISFSDVPVDSYYAEAVSWAVKTGITNGVGAGFSPYSPVKRSDFITMLYRYAGSPYAQDPTNFTDVSAKYWYSKPIGWGVATGVTVGTSTTEFGVNESCTRAQALTMIYRYLTK